MTDIEQKRIKAICKVAHIDDISDLSDGYHTFKQLYFQRMMLFAVIVKQNRDKAWKSLRHEDGELCFGGGWFIVGIDTPKGSYTYHYEDNYFSLFDCVELERGKPWDGHTEKDVIRLLSLEQEPCEEGVSREAILDEINRVGIKAFKTYNDYSQLYDFVDTLSPVKSQKRTGYWRYIPKRRLVDETDEGGVYITDYKCTCSECGGNFGFQKMSDTYCKYCGVRMEGARYG